MFTRFAFRYLKFSGETPVRFRPYRGRDYRITVIFYGYGAWRDYEKGELISGIKFPDGLKKHQKLASPVITPSTKAELGEHDVHISREDIIEKDLVDKETYEQLEEYSMKLFEYGQ